MRSMTIYNYLLEATIFGSLLILLQCILRACFRKQVGNKLIFAAWLMVALRLLLPLSLPNPLMNELRPALSMDMAARPLADQIRVHSIATIWNAADVLQENTAEQVISKALSRLALQAYRGEIGKWLLLGYGSVSLLVGLLLGLNDYRLRRRIRRDRVGKLNDHELMAYHELCLKLKIHPVPVYFVDKLRCPCTVGAFHPFIALPSDLKPVHLQACLMHELCHCKTHAGFAMLLGNLCCVVHWLNPLVWMGARLCRVDGELACDSQARLFLDDSQRLGYGDALTAYENQNMHSGRAPVTGQANDARLLHRRMQMVVSHFKPNRAVIALSGVLLLCITVFSFATSERYTSITFGVQPKVSWRAGNENIPNEANAVAYTRRFLENAYVGVPTADMSFTTSLNEADKLWTVEGTRGLERYLLTFGQDGVIKLYDGLCRIKEVDLSVQEQTAPVLTDSEIEYLEGYVKACLPHRKWQTAFHSEKAMGEKQQYLLFSVYLESDEETPTPLESFVGVLVNDFVSVVYYAESYSSTK